MKTQPKQTPEHYASCNGCGISMTEIQIKYTIEDGYDYCKECTEAIQSDDESSGRLAIEPEVYDTVREAAKAEMGVDYEPHMSQTDQSFIHGAEFGSKWEQEKSYSEQQVRDICNQLLLYAEAYKNQPFPISKINFDKLLIKI